MFVLRENEISLGEIVEYANDRGEAFFYGRG
jgi:hypothetical protein